MLITDYLLRYGSTGRNFLCLYSAMSVGTVLPSWNGCAYQSNWPWGCLCPLCISGAEAGSLSASRWGMHLWRQKRRTCNEEIICIAWVCLPHALCFGVVFRASHQAPGTPRLGMSACHVWQTSGLGVVVASPHGCGRRRAPPC